MLTDISIIHILASIVNYPLRFKVPLSAITVEYITALILPVLLLLLHYLMFFRKTFIEREKGHLTQTERIIQLSYLIAIILVFSYEFMVQPFIVTELAYSGQWYFISFLAVLAIVTLIMTIVNERSSKEKEKPEIEEDK